MRNRISRREFIGNEEPGGHISGGRLSYQGRTMTEGRIKSKAACQSRSAAQKGAGS
ncbi:hypothetical protein YDYSY3_02870 [Paenibacillus chitinolyticus]|nr:hypothetical protein YDYSY3_02870 [Paenibacillus chitinolyticus]